MLVGLFIMVQVCKEYYWLQSLGGMDTLLFDLEDDDYDSWSLVGIRRKIRYESNPLLDTQEDRDDNLNVISYDRGYLGPILILAKDSSRSMVFGEI